MQDHLENECPKQVLPCPFIECGCDYRGERSQITKHLKESPGLHLNVAGKTISVQRKLLQAFEERLNEQKKWIEVLARKVNALEKTYGAQYIWKIDHYEVLKMANFSFSEVLCLFYRNDYKKLEQIKKQLYLVHHF